MLSKQHIGRLVKDGWIKRAGRGQYDRVDAVHGYIRFLKDEGRRASKTVSYSRLQDARTRKAELAVAEAERELVPLADAMTVVDEVAGSVVSCFGALPARVTRNVSERVVIQREVDGALADVAARIEKLKSAFQSGDDE